MTGIKPRYMCFHEAICRHTFSKGVKVHLCKVCDCVVLIIGNMLFHFSLIGKLNLSMYNLGYYRERLVIIIANANREGTKTSSYLLFCLSNITVFTGLNLIQFVTVVGKGWLPLSFIDNNLFSTRTAIKVLNFGAIPSCSH